MQTNHEKGAVGHLAGKFDHAGACRQKINRRRCRASVPQPRRRWPKLDTLSAKELSNIADRFPHDSHACARLSYTPRRNETARHSEVGAVEHVFLFPAHDLERCYTMPEAELQAFERVIRPRLGG